MTDIQKVKEKVINGDTKNNLNLSKKTIDIKRGFWENLIGIMEKAGVEIEVLEKMRKKKAANDDVMKKKAANDDVELAKVA